MTLAERFHIAADKWERETCYLSSPTQIMAHPSFQEIMAFESENKEELIKLILEDMVHTRKHWFWALTKLTGDQPIPKAHAGYIDKMIEDWKEWGIEKGYLNG
jgi:hypothetical protein